MRFKLKPSAYYMKTNEPLKMVVLTALVGAGLALGVPWSGMD
jgi:hypothetical protein